jgi:hypothetical protein
MRWVIDVCLSPLWVRVFTDAGHEALHWSAAGDIRASDEVILDWAAKTGAFISHMTWTSEPSWQPQERRVRVFFSCVSRIRILLLFEMQ